MTIIPDLDVGPRTLRFMPDALKAGLDPYMAQYVGYRKSGLSLNHIIGCPLDCGYCVQARRHTAIAAVQNRHSVDIDDLALGYAEQHGLAYVAHQPFRSGADLARLSPTDRVARAQDILRLLLQRSTALVTIPGTHSLRHLAENSTAFVS